MSHCPMPHPMPRACLDNASSPTADGALRDLQQRFVAYLLQGDPGLRAEVVGHAPLGTDERLGIYGEAYRLRLLEALAVDFPAVRALVGEQAFERLGLDYIAHHPSRHFSIRYFGASLSRFLAEHGVYRDRPYLAEMAAFEWSLGEVFDAADRLTITLEQMAAVPPPAWAEMRLRFHPTLRRLDLHWNVAPVWTALVQEGGSYSLTRTEAAVAWLVWRRDLRSFFRSLGPEEAWALDAARRGKPFGEWCIGLCQWVGEEQAAAQAARLLRTWVVDGLVTAVADA